MTIIEAAFMWNSGKAMRRRAWSTDPQDDNFCRSLRKNNHDGRVMSTNRAGNNWYEHSLTPDDLLADDWEEAQ